MLFLFLLIIDLYFLIHAVIAQTLTRIVELTISIRIPIKVVKVETEIHPVIVEAKIRKCSI